MKYVDIRRVAASPPAVESENVLQAALDPVGVDDFLANYWRQKALAIVPGKSPAARAAATARLAPLCRELHDLDLPELLAHTASERIFAWLGARVDSASASARGLRSFELDSAKAACAVHECGASLYFRAPPAFGEEWVGAACAALGLGAGARHPSGELRGEVEVFVSRKGHATDWHFDFMENITFQLRGSKTWRIAAGEPRVTHPVRGATPHYAHAGNLEQQIAVHRLQAPAFQLHADALAAVGARAESVTLEAGSVLYFPAGAWHRVECEEDSLSVNLSLLGATWAELIADAVRQRAYASAALRAIVTVPPLASASGRRDAARAQCAAALEAQRAALASLRAEDLLPECVFNAPPECGYVDLLAETERRAPLRAPSAGERGGGGKRRKLHEAAGKAAGKAARDAGGESRPLRLRLNPLCVLVKDADALGEVRRKLADAHDDDDDDDDDDAVGLADEEAGSGSGTGDDGSSNADDGSDEQGDGDEAAEGDDERGEGAEPALYAALVNFGSEDLVPHTRSVLAVPREVEPLVDWLGRTALERCNSAGGHQPSPAGPAPVCAVDAHLDVEEVLAHGRLHGLDEETCVQTLRVLMFHGYATLIADDS